MKIKAKIAVLVMALALVCQGCGIYSFSGASIPAEAKTVSVALSKEQYEAMRDAIANLKYVKARLARLEELSRLVIFRTSQDTHRFKRPTRATLGLGKRPKSP